MTADWITLLVSWLLVLFLIRGTIPRIMCRWFRSAKALISKQREEIKWWMK